MKNKKLIFLMSILYSLTVSAVDPNNQLIALAQGGALNEERLGALLRQGANINAEDGQVLREAVFLGDEPQIRLLIKYGAQPDDQMLAHAVNENQGYIIRILLDYKPAFVTFKFLQNLLYYAAKRELRDSMDAIIFSKLYQEYIAQKEVGTMPTKIVAFPVYSVIRDRFNNPIEVKKSSGVYRLFEQSTIQQLSAHNNERIKEIISLVRQLHKLEERMAQETNEVELQQLTSRAHALSQQIHELRRASSIVTIKGKVYFKDPLGGGVWLLELTHRPHLAIKPVTIASNYPQYLQQLMAWQNLLEATGSASPEFFLHDGARAEIEAFLRTFFRWDKDRKLPQKLQISVNNIVVQDPISLKEFIVDENVALAIVVLVLYETPRQAQKFLSELEKKNPALIANKRVKTYNLNVLKTALENTLLEQERSMSISPLSMTSEE